MSTTNANKEDAPPAAAEESSNIAVINGNTTTTSAPNTASTATAASVDDDPTASATDTLRETCTAPPEALDPLLQARPNTVREGDYVLLQFADGRQFMVQCVHSRTAASKSKCGYLKFNKRSYSSHTLIGLAYGTVLEVGRKQLEVLDDATEGLLPAVPNVQVAGATNDDGDDSKTAAKDDTDSTFPTAPPAQATVAPSSTADASVQPDQEQERDNRHLVDDNTSQALDFETLERMRQEKAGKEIVQCIIENSSSFKGKTDFSRQKYITRKQIKYQPRCRLVKANAATICEALYLKDAKKIMNLRQDSLGQILAYSNISAGCQCLVFETIQGLVTGAVAERMGGYGRVFSIYSGQQPNFLESMDRFNLSFGETNSIKWVHSGDVFSSSDANPADGNDKDDNNSSNKQQHEEEEEEEDLEAADRNTLHWPCPLQEHTRQYLLGPDFTSDKKRREFLKRRCARFARKLTRQSPMEAAKSLRARKCDSVIIATRYNPTETLLQLLPLLAPSCPFVVFCEYMEPLTECFTALQTQQLAINLRLSDTWMREYQMLPGRTHPNMNMSQSGGFILTGIKLDEEFGRDEMDEALLQEIRQEMGPRRGKKKKAVVTSRQEDDTKSKKSRKATTLEERQPKRSRTGEEK